MKLNRLLPVLIVGSAGLLFFVFLSWHWNLGLNRYFDVDEYAHLHWAAKVFAGKSPYIDYLSFFTPVFHWFLSPIFLFGWGTTLPFIAGRVMMFGVFLGLSVVTMMIFWELRGSVSRVRTDSGLISLISLIGNEEFGFTLLVGALLCFLPMPFDKYLEIRPDSLATLFTLLAIYFQIVWMKKNTNKDALLSGIFYSLSLLVLSKMLPNIAVGVGIAGVWGIANIKYQISNIKSTHSKDSGQANQKSKRTEIKQIFVFYSKELRWFVIGLSIPAVLFGLWVLSLGNFSLVWYSLVKLPVEANKISKYFIMMPDLFFYPNSIFYGVDGWGRIVIINHIIWAVGLFVGIYRLFSPWVTILNNPISTNKYQLKNTSRVLIEILVALQFLCQVVFYVEFVPLKHAQYLIPIGVFVALYTADGLLLLKKWLNRHPIGEGVGTGLFILGAVLMYLQFVQANTPKLGWTNKQALADITDMYTKVAQSEPILDLDGRMLFNPDSFYACCIPFGQSAEFLSRPLPSLAEALERTNTKYINQGELKRVNTLPWNDQQYIYSHYRAIGENETILVRNDIEE